MAYNAYSTGRPVLKHGLTRLTSARAMKKKQYASNSCRQLKLQKMFHAETGHRKKNQTGEMRQRAT